MKKALALLTIAIIVFQGFALLATTVNATDQHDIAVISVVPNTPHEYPERIVNITVVVKNNGNVSENFDVTTYRNTTAIDTKHVSNLTAGNNVTLTFNWNTTGLTPGGQNWTIRAEAPLVGDINPGDNNVTDSTVFIKMLGDVNADKIIDILDIVVAAVSFGAEYGKPPPPGTQPYNPQADVWADGVINIFDLVEMAQVFGTKY